MHYTIFSLIYRRLHLILFQILSHIEYNLYSFSEYELRNSFRSIRVLIPRILLGLTEIIRGEFLCLAIASPLHSACDVFEPIATLQ